MRRCRSDASEDTIPCEMSITRESYICILHTFDTCAHNTDRTFWIGNFCLTSWTITWSRCWIFEIHTKSISLICKREFKFHLVIILFCSEITFCRCLKTYISPCCCRETSFDSIYLDIFKGNSTLIITIVGWQASTNCEKFDITIMTTDGEIL